MTVGSTYHLTGNVRSSLGSCVLYGKQGEQVKILGDHGEVLTVQGECGTFSVRRELLSEEPVLPSTEPEVIHQTIPTKKQPTKKPIQITNKLF